MNVRCSGELIMTIMYLWDVTELRQTEKATFNHDRYKTIITKYSKKSLWKFGLRSWGNCSHLSIAFFKTVKTLFRHEIIPVIRVSQTLIEYLRLSLLTNLFLLMKNRTGSTWQNSQCSPENDKWRSWIVSEKSLNDLAVVWFTESQNCWSGVEFSERCDFENNLRDFWKTWKMLKSDANQIRNNGDSNPTLWLLCHCVIILLASKTFQKVFGSWSRGFFGAFQQSHCRTLARQTIDDCHQREPDPEITGECEREVQRQLLKMIWTGMPNAHANRLVRRNVINELSRHQWLRIDCVSEALASKKIRKEGRSRSIHFREEMHTSSN
jgi:hypothetical protein